VPSLKAGDTAFPTVFSSPTKKPIATPTKIPTVSPTASPTIDFTPYLVAAVKKKVAALSNENTVVYSGIESGSSAGCNAWRYFNSDLSNSQIVKSAASIQLISYKALELPEPRSVSYVCDNSDAATVIVGSLETATTTTKVVTACKGDYWVVAKCSGSNAPSLCVNCDDPCTSKQFECHGFPAETETISSCTTFCRRTDYSAKLLAVTLQPKDTPPLVTLNATRSGRTSITLEYLMSKNGLMYCVAMLPGENVTTSTIIAGSLVQSIDEVAVVTLAGLDASTDYSIFCLSKSFVGAYSDIADSIANKVDSKTLCCKYITVTVPVKSLAVGFGRSPFMYVVLEALPLTNITLTPIVNSSNPPSFSPLVRTIGNSIQSLTEEFALRGFSIPGMYSYDVEVGGPSAHEYTVVYESMSTQTFLLSTVVPVPGIPSVSSVRFSASGCNIEVRFNAMTNRAGSVEAFSCGTLFSFAGIAGSACRWNDPSTAVIALSGTASGVIPGSMLTIKGGILRARCTSDFTAAACALWATLGANTVAVGVPLEQRYPVVSMSAPSVLGICRNYTVDIGGSTGSACRPWKSVTFTARSFTAPTMAIETLLNNPNRDQFVMFEIPDNYFITNSYYVLTTKLCNFLGFCSRSDTEFVTTTNVEPVLLVEGEVVKSFTVNTAIVVSVTAESLSCEGGVLPITYTWSMFDATNTIVSVDSTSKKAFIFRLEKYAVPIGSYTLVVIATDSDGAFSKATVTVVVTASRVINAIIDGGSSVFIAPDKTTIFDGGSSTDADYADGRSDQLSFSWTCMQITPVPASASVCGLTIANGLVSSSLNVRGSVSDEDVVHRLVLVVSKTVGGMQTVFDSTSVDVSVTDVSKPLVVLSTSVQRPNANNKITVGGTVTFPQVPPALTAVSAVWSVSLYSVLFSLEEALTPASYVIDSNMVMAASDFTFELVTPPNMFYGGSSYVFTLSLHYSNAAGDEIVGTSSLEIAVNDKPQPGLLIVTPTSGVELSTIFFLAATSWADPDGPLLYEFGIQTTPTVTATLRERLSSSNFATILSAGSSDDAFALVLELKVIDQLGSSSVVTTTCTVRETSQEMQYEYLESIGSTRRQLLEGTDVVADNLRAVTLASQLLTRVVCTNSPNCTSLGRSNCSILENTCGSCLSGYFDGKDNSDANSTCIKLPEYSGACLSNAVTAPLHIYSSSLASCGAGLPCSYPWEYCNGDSICVKEEKYCLSDCSGRGQCIFSDRTTKETIATCSMGDISCSAVCICDAGYAGTGCIKTDAVLDQLKTLKASLISILDINMLKSDSSTGLLQGSANVLYLLTSIPDENYVGVAYSAYSLAESILDITRNIGANVADFGAILLSSIDTVTESLDTESELFLLTFLRAYSALLADETSAYEMSSTGKYDNFYFVVGSALSFNENLNSMSNESFSIVTVPAPQSQLDCFAGAEETEAVLNGQFGVDDRVLLVKLNSVLSPDNVTFNSNVVSLSVLSTAATATIEKYVTVKLIDVLPVSYTNDSDPENVAWKYTVSTVCEHGKQLLHENVCPLSGFVLHHNCTGVAGVFQTRCPRYRTEINPACHSLSGPSVQCLTASYDYATGPVCRCDIVADPPSSSRRALATAERVWAHIVVGSVVTHNTTLVAVFPSKFAQLGDYSAPDLVSATMFSVFSYIVAAFSVVLLVTLFRENRDSAFDSPPTSLTIASSVESEMAAEALVNAALPELRSMATGREVNNLWHLHTWVRLVISNDHSLRFYSHLSDVHMVLYSFVHILSAMLVTTILYGATEPNDDFCYEQTLRSDCLADHTFFTRMNDRCHWDTEGGCSLRHMQESVEDIFFTALVVSFCCVIIKALVEYMLMHVCGMVRKGPAPAAGAAKKALTTPDIIRNLAGKRTQQVGVESTKKTNDPLDDFHFVNRGILKKRNSFLEDGPVKEAFCTAWGIKFDDKHEKATLPLPPPRKGRFTEVQFKSQMAANMWYNDLVRAHKMSDVPINETKNLLSCVGSAARHQKSLEVFFDVQVLQTLFYDLLPEKEAVVAKASLLRQMPAPVFNSSALVPPAYLTVILVYVLAASAHILFFAASRTHALQALWILTVLAWFVIDAFAVQPLMICINGYLIPSVASDSIFRAKLAIVTNLIMLNAKGCCSFQIYRNGNSSNSLRPLGDESSGGAPQKSLGLMFFASARLAMQSGPVSSRAIDLVAKFSSSYPRLPYHIWAGPARPAGFLRGGVRTFYLTIVAAFESLNQLLSAALLEITLLVAAWFLLFSHLLLYEHHTAIEYWIPTIVVGAILFLVVLRVLFASLSSTSSAIQPVPAPAKGSTLTGQTLTAITNRRAKAVAPQPGADKPSSHPFFKSSSIELQPQGQRDSDSVSVPLEYNGPKMIYRGNSVAPLSGAEESKPAAAEERSASVKVGIAPAPQDSLVVERMDSPDPFDLTSRPGSSNASERDTFSLGPEFASMANSMSLSMSMSSKMPGEEQTRAPEPTPVWRRTYSSADRIVHQDMAVDVSVNEETTEWRKPYNSGQRAVGTKTVPSPVHVQEEVERAPSPEPEPEPEPEPAKPSYEDPDSAVWLRDGRLTEDASHGSIKTREFFETEFEKMTRITGEKIRANNAMQYKRSLKIGRGDHEDSFDLDAPAAAEERYPGYRSNESSFNNSSFNNSGMWPTTAKSEFRSNVSNAASPRSPKSGNPRRRSDALQQGGYTSFTGGDRDHRKAGYAPPSKRAAGEHPGASSFSMPSKPDRHAKGSFDGPAVMTDMLFPPQADEDAEPAPGSGAVYGAHMGSAKGGGESALDALQREQTSANHMGLPPSAFDRDAAGPARPVHDYVNDYLTRGHSGQSNASGAGRPSHSQGLGEQGTREMMRPIRERQSVARKNMEARIQEANEQRQKRDNK
jgi:hypothetical protein